MLVASWIMGSILEAHAARQTLSPRLVQPQVQQKVQWQVHLLASQLRRLLHPPQLPNPRTLGPLRRHVPAPSQSRRRHMQLENAEPLAALGGVLILYANLAFFGFLAFCI